MRCPKCGETYDNSWKMCLNCNEKLVDDAVISSEKADELKENIKKIRRPKLLNVKIFGIYIIIVGLIKLFLVNAAEPSQDIIIGNFLSLLLIMCGVGMFF